MRYITFSYETCVVHYTPNVHSSKTTSSNFNTARWREKKESYRRTSQMGVYGGGAPLTLFFEAPVCEGDSADGRAGFNVGAPNAGGRITAEGLRG